MTKPQKVGLSLFFIVNGSLLLVLIFQNRTTDKQLSECSVYTTAHITRMYQLRGMAHIEYDFSIQGKSFQADEAVNNFDTGESWSVDFKKLSERKLLLKVHCDDPNVHRILWDVPVPDTLRHVPDNGWKEMPFKKKSGD